MSLTVLAKSDDKSINTSYREVTVTSITEDDNKENNENEVKSDDSTEATIVKKDDKKLS